VACSRVNFTFCFRLRLKRDGTRAETRFRLSAKRTSPFKSAGASFQSTTGSRGVRIRGSNAGYIMFRGSVKSTRYPLHSPVSPSLPLSCVTVCLQISTGLYLFTIPDERRTQARITDIPSQCRALVETVRFSRSTMPYRQRMYMIQNTRKCKYLAGKNNILHASRFYFQ